MCNFWPSPNITLFHIHCFSISLFVYVILHNCYQPNKIVADVLFVDQLVAHCVLHLHMFVKAGF